MVFINGVCDEEYFVLVFTYNELEIYWIDKNEQEIMTDIEIREYIEIIELIS